MLGEDRDGIVVEIVLIGVVIGSSSRVADVAMSLSAMPVYMPSYEWSRLKCGGDLEQWQVCGGRVELMFTRQDMVVP